MANYINKNEKLFYLFILLIILISSPITGFLSITNWIRLPIFIIIIILPILYFNVTFIYKYELYFLVFILFSTFSLIFNKFTTKSLNYYITFPWILFGYLIPLRRLLQSINFKFIAKPIFFVLIVFQLFIIFDFVLKNFFGIGIRDFVTINNVTINMNYFSRSGLFFTGGTAEEPGIMSFMLNIFYFIIIFYFQVHLISITKFLLLTCLHLLTLFFLGSTTGILIFLLVLSFTFINIKLLIPLIAFLIIIFIFANFNLNNDLFGEILLKLSFNSQLESVDLRQIAWYDSIKVWLDNPFFGAGPGYGRIKYDIGFTGLGFQVLAEMGIFSFIILLLFFTYFFKISFFIYKKTKSKLFIFGIFFSIVHLFTINEYYHIPFWFFLVFCHYTYKFYEIQPHYTNLQFREIH